MSSYRSDMEEQFTMSSFDKPAPYSASIAMIVDNNAIESQQSSLLNSVDGVKSRSANESTFDFSNSIKSSIRYKINVICIVFCNFIFNGMQSERPFYKIGLGAQL